MTDLLHSELYPNCDLDPDEIHEDFIKLLKRIEKIERSRILERDLRLLIQDIQVREKSLFREDKKPNDVYEEMEILSELKEFKTELEMMI